MISPLFCNRHRYCKRATVPLTKFFYYISWAFLGASKCNLGFSIHYTAWKVSVLGVFLVRFFPHLESECGIIRTRKTLNTDTFCTVISFHTPDERSSLIQTGYKFNPCFKMFSDVKLRKNGLDLLPDFKLSFLKTESVFFLNCLKYGLKLSIWH